MKHFLVLLLLITGTLSLYGSSDDLTISKGTDQEVIAKLSPSVAQTDVWNNAKIEVSFSVPLDASSVQKNNIKLVHLSSKTNDHIDGTIDYDKFDNKVVYTPNGLLSEGVYEVEIKSLKADKAYKTTQIKEIKYRFYVPEVINGHQLPPEPDPVVNDSTLLGIDVNGNGVRDDVERAILKEYDEPKDRVALALAMQYAKAFQIIIKDPANGLKTKKYLNAGTYCYFYYSRLAGKYDDTIYFTKHNDPSKFLKPFQFNTEERIRAYFLYDAALSGKVYQLPPFDTYKSYCDFNASELMDGVE